MDDLEHGPHVDWLHGLQEKAQTFEEFQTLMAADLRPMLVEAGLVSEDD